VSDAELLFVCCVAAILVLATFLTFVARRRVMSDYWLPDGSKDDQSLDKHRSQFVSVT
jgi:hypothetical protein